MTALAANGSSNLACLSPTDRHLIEADKTACLLRWKCRNLKGAERKRMFAVLLGPVPATARPAVEAALRARASR